MLDWIWQSSSIPSGCSANRQYSWTSIYCVCSNALNAADCIIKGRSRRMNSQNMFNETAAIMLEKAQRRFLLSKHAHNCAAFASANIKRLPIIIRYAITSGIQEIFYDRKGCYCIPSVYTVNRLIFISGSGPRARKRSGEGYGYNILIIRSSWPDEKGFFIMGIKRS